MRLIDADALKKQLCLDKFEAITRSPERRMVTFDEIAAFIDYYAPTIEPKRGEWIQTSNDWIAGTCGAMFYPYHCSSCGYETYDDYDGLYNFCPNCGCRMKGANDE